MTDAGRPWWLLPQPWRTRDEPYVSLGSSTVARIDTSRRDDPEFTDPRPVGFTARLEPAPTRLGPGGRRPPRLRRYVPPEPVAEPLRWEGDDS